ncbi:MAG: hypothetical protein DSY81_11420 [Bacillota bacterium]|nr:MAG: hypothetical protein DSY92_05970 [Planctomycetota bacterium]RUA07746.1 MAG: hypothetical protein DSY81_11420 [Bacillota bacterium]
MIRNALLTIGFLWFSLAPTLCAAGVLPHVCESFRFLGSEHSCVDGEDGHYEEHCSQGCKDDGSSHDRSSHDPCTHDDFVCIHDGCSHDACSHDACVNDPYLVRDLVQKDRTRDFQFSGQDAHFVSDALPVHPYFITSPRPCVHCRVQAAGKNIPFHASDIPLLA